MWYLVRITVPAVSALAEMTNNPIIQEFRLMGCNDFVVASNTARSTGNPCA